jgi:hypothetical protein
VLPLRLAALPPLADPLLPAGIAPPPQLSAWSRTGAPQR